MAHLTDIDVTAPAHSLFSGGTVLNTWRTRIDVLNDALGDITAAEANQVENIATTTISAAQWGYLGACTAGGGQLLAALTAGESTQLEAIGSTTISAAQWGYLGACTAGGGQLLAALTASESTQLEAIGATTISLAQWGYLGACGAGGGQLLAALTTGESTQLEGIGSVTITNTQWGYLGALNQGLTTTSTVTFGTINAFTLGGKLTAGDSEIEGNAFDINGGTINGITDLAVADGGTGASNATNARSNLGLVIGTNVLAQQTIGIADDNLLEVDDTDAASTDYARFTAAGLQGRDATEVKTDLGLVIGTNVLAHDAGLSNLAGIAMAADKFYYTSGDNTHVAATVTSFARTILDDANAATALGTLGLSTDLPNLTDAEVTQLEAIGDVTISYAQWGYLGACGAGGGQLLAALTAGESTQLEAIGTTTISAAQWGYLGTLDTVGWISAGETWTYASATTFTISGDKTGKYQESDKIKLTNATVKYFYIVAVSYSSPNTTVTVLGGSDYALADAAISANYYSKIASPQGFPQWFNWTITWTGFSADPSSGASKFNIENNTCSLFIDGWSPGTSNAAGFDFTVPITSIGANYFVMWAQVQDNGTWQNTSGCVGIGATGGTTAKVGITLVTQAGNAFGGFTASGNKILVGMFVYPI